MTREDAKDWAPIIQAFADGKQMQHRNNEQWADVDCVRILEHYPDDYRIKPDPVYRPFKDGKELVAEYCKRFGVERKAWEMPSVWLERKEQRGIAVIFAMNSWGVYFGNLGRYCCYADLLTGYTFLDGSPCGVEEASDASSN